MQCNTNGSCQKYQLPLLRLLENVHYVGNLNTGFHATTVTVHILERLAEIMERDKRNTEKK